MFKQIKVVEQAKFDEKTKVLCDYSEDQYLFTPKLIAVADGVLSKAKNRVVDEYTTDGEWMARTVVKVLEDIAKEREKTKLDDPKEILNRLADGVIDIFFRICNRREARKNKFLNKIDHPVTSLTLAYQHIQDPKKHTFIGIGDGHIFYSDKVIPRSDTRKQTESERIGRLKAVEDRGIPNPGRPALIESTRAEFYRRNNPDSYPAIDITKDWINHHEVKIVETTLDKGDKVLLCSDGLTRWFDMYNQCTEAEFHERAFSGDLQGILDDVRRLEFDDWANRKFVRYKKTDDICAILAEIQ